MTFKHQLGAKAVDRISGFKGVITIRAEYLHSPNHRYEVTPEAGDATGKPIEPQWFDEGRIYTGTPAEAQG